MNTRHPHPASLPQPLLNPPLVKPLRIALLNPNTNTEATRLMLESAQRVLPHWARVEGRTAPRGTPLITNNAALDAAAQVVATYGCEVAAEGFDVVVVAGFGDPGLQVLRALLPIPVVGIAEAGIREAGAGGRRYSIVTITHDLHASLQRSAFDYGHGSNLASIRFTQGDPLLLANNAQALELALLHTSQQAITHDGAQAIVIGGGPLARAANAIAPQLSVPLIEPVAAAMRWACRGELGE